MLTQGDGSLAGREGVIRCIFLSVSKIRFNDSFFTNS